MTSSAPFVRYLVADDYPDMAETLAFALEGEGKLRCTVDVAHNGDEAVALAIAERPAAAILDLEMPVLNGIGAAVAIKKHYADQPPLIVGMTGSLHQALAAETSEAIDYLLIKPVSMRELLEVLMA